MARCKSCDEPMLWANSEKGKSIPVDAEDQGGHLVPKLVHNGNLVLCSGTWANNPTVRYVKPGTGSYVSHFATCEFADQHRSKR